MTDVSRIVRIEFIQGLLAVVLHMKVTGDSYLCTDVSMAGRAIALAIQIDEWLETGWLPADVGEVERQPCPTGPHSAFRRSARSDPDRKVPFVGARRNFRIKKRRSELALPCDALLRCDLEKQRKLLGKKSVIVPQIVAKQRKGLYECAAPYGDL